jgi:hypothetical protein
MAEAAAMALAATLLESLQLYLQQGTILSDNQQLVNFLNDSDLAHPPDWRIKPYTQMALHTDYQHLSAQHRHIYTQDS